MQGTGVKRLEGRDSTGDAWNRGELGAGLRGSRTQGAGVQDS